MFKPILVETGNNVWYNITILNDWSVYQMENTKQYKIRDDFKTLWKQWEEPVKTLEELQEALDLSDEYITIWVVKSVNENGILTYTEQKFEDLEPDTKINLWGVRFESDEFSPATAIIQLQGSRYETRYDPTKRGNRKKSR